MEEIERDLFGNEVEVKKSRKESKSLYMRNYMKIYRVGKKPYYQKRNNEYYRKPGVKEKIRKAYLARVSDPVVKRELLERGRKSRLDLKLKVLGYYGDGEAKCILCGENRINCLSIDHVNGGGMKHRRSLGTLCSTTFYRFLVTEGFPVGYRTLCMNCQFLERERLRFHGGCQPKLTFSDIQDGQEGA